MQRGLWERSIAEIGNLRQQDYHFGAVSFNHLVFSLSRFSRVSAAWHVYILVVIFTNSFV